MKSRKATVKSDVTGKVQLAEVLVCDCGGETFVLFILEGRHNHIQCVTCGKSFCDGTCAQKEN